jgi:hypothetical protein
MDVSVSTGSGKKIERLGGVSGGRKEREGREGPEILKEELGEAVSARGSGGSGRRAHRRSGEVEEEPNRWGPPIIEKKKKKKKKERDGGGA